MPIDPDPPELDPDDPDPDWKVYGPDDVPPPQEERYDPDVWVTLKMKAARDGKPTGPHVHIPNILRVFRGDSRIALRWNDFERCAYLGDERVTDDTETGLTEWLGNVYYMHVSSQMMTRCVQKIARERPYHPVRDYLAALEWDGERRADDLMERYFGAQRSSLHCVIGRRWLVSCVARAFDPGCKVDTTLILVGPQGELKSTAFQALAVNPAWFSDSMLDLRNKDAYQSLQGVWIYELAELDSIARREMSAVKAFLSSPSDNFRPSYGRYNIRCPRQVIFVGSTNDDVFLLDPTGSRRFWPVRVGAVQIGLIEEDRDQLWAEAVHLYRAGEKHWMSKDEATELAKESAQHQHVDPWEDHLEQWTTGRAEEFTVSEALFGALGVFKDKQGKYDGMRVAAILQRLGFTMSRHTIGGQKRHWWAKRDG